MAYRVGSCGTSRQLSQPLAAIFNASVREGYFPPVWKAAEVTNWTPLVPYKPSSNMQLFFHQLLSWADQNDMVINLAKTMVLGPPSITSNYLQFPPALIKYKEPAKLNCLVSTLILIFLGTLMSRPLYRRQLSDCIFSSSLSVRGFLAQLLHFYISVIRPVLEYAVPVWHHLLTKSQTDSIESVQKRALRIFYPFSNDMPYTVTI